MQIVKNSSWRKRKNSLRHYLLKSTNKKIIEDLTFRCRNVEMDGLVNSLGCLWLNFIRVIFRMKWWTRESVTLAIYVGRLFSYQASLGDTCIRIRMKDHFLAVFAATNVLIKVISFFTNKESISKVCTRHQEIKEYWHWLSLVHDKWVYSICHPCSRLFWKDATIAQFASNALKKLLAFAVIFERTQEKSHIFARHAVIKQFKKGT